MEPGRLTILQAKFAAYLPASQPFLHELMTGLDRHVRNVIVCSRRENSDRFPARHVHRISDPKLVFPSLAVLEAARLQRRFRPDLIHAHFGWSGVRALLLRHFLDLPLVTTFGGRDATVQSDQSHMERLYRLLFAVSDRIVCVSKSLEGELVARGAAPERIEVVRRGTRLDKFAYSDRSARKPGPLRVLMVGRLVEKKGHRYVLEALAELARAGVDLRLRLVGEGNRYRELASLARALGLRRRVKFLGTVSHDEIAAEMRAADVFVHASVRADDGDSEGLPNALVEAAASGLALVATAHGGIVEAIEHERSGLLVAERDVRGMAEAIRALAGNPARRLELGRGAAARMRSDFDIEAQVRRYREIYRELAEKRAAGARPAAPASIPPDLPALLDHGLRRDRAGEPSVAELLGLQLDHGRIAGDPAADATLLERAYAWKRLVPQPFKQRTKSALKSLRLALRRSRGSDEGFAREPHSDARVDELVLARFAAGARVDWVEPTWTPADLEARWREPDPRAVRASSL